MDAPAPPAAPPTTPGAIPDRRAGRLPVAAKVVAILDIAIGVLWTALALIPTGENDQWLAAFGLFALLGVGVLMRSNLVRIFSLLAHGLMGLLFLLTLGFTVVGLLTSVGGQGGPAGGMMLAFVAFFIALSVGLTAFFVWGCYVLNRKDVRAACQQRSTKTRTS